MCGNAGMSLLHLTTPLGKQAAPECSAAPPAANPGLFFYVMVDSVAKALDTIGADGGEIVQPVGVDAPEITARFRDPAGNLIGLYQQPS